MLDVRTGEAQARDGATLRYQLVGDERRPKRFALVHSLALDRSVWSEVAASLHDEACVLTWDCRGHGASDKPGGPYALATFADDFAAVLDAAGWEDAHVAGCSMGGNVALCFALTHPTRTRTLGLFDTTAWYGPDARKNWDDRAAKARTEGLASMIDFQQTRWFSDAFRAERPDVVAAARATFLANDVDAYAATCGMLGRFDLRERLAEIAVPTAVVVGEEDYATPLPMAQALEAGIAGATLQILPRARHLTTIERPDAVAAALAELAKRRDLAGR